MPDTKKMSGPELPSSEEERMNKLRYEYNKEVQEAIKTSNDLTDFKKKYKPFEFKAMNIREVQENQRQIRKKAKGGYVKKYAKGGGVRKVRS